MDTGRDALGIKSLNRHTLEQIVAASSAAVLVANAADPQLPIVYANAAYERLTGFAVRELTGRPWAALARAVGDELAPLRAALVRGEACRVTMADLRKDGSAYTSEVCVTPLHGPRGELKFFLLCHEQSAVASARDEMATDVGIEISSALLQRARQKMVSMERIDPATGLVRFPYFQETLQRDLAMARRDRRFVTLLIFEIEDFDVYLQTFGDKAAESCQRMIGAQVMRALRRAGDLCARYDDSTVVAAVVGQHADEIRPVADRIADNVRQLRLHNPRGKSSRYITTRVTLVSCPPGAHDDPEPVIARALADARRSDAPARAVLG